MATIIMPATTQKKSISGSFYALSGYGVFYMPSSVKNISGIQYNLTEDLIVLNGFSYVVNSESQTNGKLLNENGTAYNPNITQYPKDGTLDLTDGKYIDTQIVIPQNTEYTIIGTKDIDGLGAYVSVAIHIIGDGTADIYYADETSSFSLLPENTGIAFEIPLTSYKIVEGFNIPVISPLTTYHVSFDDEALIPNRIADPAGVTVNHYGYGVFFNVYSILASDGTNDDTVTLTSTKDGFPSDNALGLDLTGNLLSMPDTIIADYLRSTSWMQFVFSSLAYGTYTVRTAHNRNDPELNELASVNVNGTVISGLHSNNQTTPTIAEFIDVVVDATTPEITILADADVLGTGAYNFNGISIERTA